MAFTVETGAGLAAANSYASIETLTTFCSDRGLTAPASDALKQQALIAASEYIDSKYAFSGEITVAGQGLAWPRTGAYDKSRLESIDSDEVPQQVVRAVCMLAQKYGAGTTINEDLTRGGRVTSERVGSIAVSYADGPGVDVGTIFGITGLLKGLLRNVEPVPTPEYTDNGEDRYFTAMQFDNNGS